jgi:hypothetical protein
MIEMHQIFHTGVLRTWRARYFVLDAATHQIRYYESQYDTECRGIIDLATVTHITPPTMTAQANTTSHAAYFDVII